MFHIGAPERPVAVPIASLSSCFVRAAATSLAVRESFQVADIGIMVWCCERFEEQRRDICADSVVVSRSVCLHEPVLENPPRASIPGVIGLLPFHNNSRQTAAWHHLAFAARTVFLPTDVDIGKSMFRKLGAANTAKRTFTGNCRQGKVLV